VGPEVPVQLLGVVPAQVCMPHDVSSNHNKAQTLMIVAQCLDQLLVESLRSGERAQLEAD
jgi:hypothetical protein